MTDGHDEGRTRLPWWRLSASNPMLKVVVSLLAFEVIVFGLAIPGMILVSQRSVVVSSVVGGVGMVLAVMGAVLLPRIPGWVVGWATQVIGVLMGIATPMMYVVGVVFAMLWVSMLVLGRRIEGNPQFR